MALRFVVQNPIFMLLVCVESEQLGTGPGGNAGGIRIDKLNPLVYKLFNTTPSPSRPPPNLQDQERPLPP